MSENAVIVAEMVKTSQLVPSPTNPRKHFKEDAINELAESIRGMGILQPIVVRLHPSEEKKYEIVAGESRYRAANIVGLKTVPVSIKELTDLQVLQVQVVENLQRNNLDALEEAAGFKALLDASQDLVEYTIDNLADEIGKSRTYVYDSLKLLELGESMVKFFYEGKLTRSSALLIARLDPKDQSKMNWYLHNDDQPRSYRQIKEQVDQIVQTSALDKKREQRANNLKKKVAGLVRDGINAILLETYELRNEWASWGIGSIDRSTKKGYTSAKNRVMVNRPGFQNPTFQEVLSDDEIKGKVQLFEETGRSVIVFPEAPALKLALQKIESGEFQLSIFDEDSTEAQQARLTAERLRREKLVKLMWEAVSAPDFITSNKFGEMIGLIIEAALNDLFRSSNTLQIENMIGMPHNTLENLVANTDQTSDLAKYLFISLATKTTNLRWDWARNPDNEDGLETLNKFARLLDIDPNSEDSQNASTPPPAAQAQENTTGENPNEEQAGTLSEDEASMTTTAAPAVDDSALPEGFKKAKAKALKKQKKGSANADESNDASTDKPVEAEAEA